jgi:NAD(P) transhydrogenase subunit alpha
VGTPNLAGQLASTASMLYSNNLTTFVTSIVKDGELTLDLEDDILVGSPEGNDFHIPGMGGVLICTDGAMHEKQTRLGEVVQ